MFMPKIISNIWKHRLATFGFFVILFIICTAIFAPFISPYDPGLTRIDEKLKAPSRAHLLGTDHLGRDLLSRMIYGARVSLSVGFVAVSISLVIGTIIGAIAGFYGGKIEFWLMRLVDVMLCFPSFFLILTIVALLGPSIINVMIVIGLTSWMGTARLVRAEFLSLRNREFVQAVEIMGMKPRRIIFLHMLPNAMAPLFVAATLDVATAILVEAGLSFLGFGVQPPNPSWGNILTQGRLYIFDAWWLTLFPGIAIFLTVLAFNLLGEGLREILDPRLSPS